MPWRWSSCSPATPCSSLQPAGKLAGRPPAAGDLLLRRVAK
jgi:hypothetical protein